MTQQHRQTDCVVVGGGLVGMLTAWFLGRAGMTVRLLERGKICREASWAGGGILSPLLPWSYPDPVSALVQWSQQFYPQLAEILHAATGIDIEWLQSGLLMLDVSADAHISKWAERHECSLQSIDGRHLSELEPGLGMFPRASLLLLQVAQLRNPQLCKALGRMLPNVGVVLHEQTEVTGFIEVDGRVQGVISDRGEYPADRVIVAGGAWSPLLLQKLGLELPVKPVRGQMIQYQASAGLLQHIVLYRDHYLIPRRDGLILAGSTLEDVGYEDATTVTARKMLMQRATELLPILDNYEVVRHWSGLRPGVSDGVPFIGQHPAFAGLFINTGHFRNGVVMAPASARLLADQILQQDSFTDTAPFQLHRA
ncbi:MAG: glycine oxidase ThiO [Pseudomonadota bacterium]